MWYPKRSQWIVIWIAFLLAFVLWLDAKEFVDLHLFILIAAVFLVWMLEGPKNRSH